MAVNTDLYSLLEASGELRRAAFKKGEILIRPYADEGRFYIICDGLVKVYGINHLGEEEIQIIYTRGDIFPLHWLTQKAYNNCFFEAMNDCTLSYIPEENLSQLLENNASIAHGMLRQLAEQFAIYAARVHNLSYKYSRERLAYRLLLMAKRFGETNHSGTLLLPLISQQDIGAAINLTRESVNRELSRFERLGLIRHEHGQICILEPERLRKEIGTEEGQLYFDDL